MSKVAFLETCAQLDSLLTFSAEKGHEMHLVAATPEADYFAQLRGVRYRTIEECYSERDLMERGMQNFARVREFCDYYTTRVHAAFDRFPSAPLVSCVSDFYYFKVMFDNLLNIVIMVGETLRFLNAREVVHFQVRPWKLKDWFDRPAFGLMSGMVPHIAVSRGCSLIPMPSDAPHGLPIPQPTFNAPSSTEPAPKCGLALTPKDVVLRILRQVGLEKHVRTAWARLHGRKPHDNGLRNETGEPWLIAIPTHDVISIVDQWQSGHHPGMVIDLSSVDFGVSVTSEHREAGRSLWEALCSDSCFRQFFVIDGIDTWPFVEDVVFHYSVDILPNEVAFMEVAPRVFEALRPAALLTVGNLRHMQAASRQGGVPSVIVQHGGGIGYNAAPIAEYTEFLGNDVYLTYGPSVSRSLRRPRPEAGLSPADYRCAYVSVGSPELDELHKTHRREASKSKALRTVMYVPVILGGDFRYHTNAWYPSLWSWRLQMEVVLLCAGFSDLHLIIKRDPHDKVHNPITNLLEDKHLANCRIVDIPFKEALGMADAYILDTPFTTLLQAMTTSKPIVVLAESAFLCVDPGIKQLLEKRVKLAETREDFLTAIDELLRRPSWHSPQPVDDDFLKEYGTYLNDGRSAERAVRVLKQLALKGREKVQSQAGPAIAVDGVSGRQFGEELPRQCGPRLGSI